MCDQTKRCAIDHSAGRFTDRISRGLRFSGLRPRRVSSSRSSFARGLRFQDTHIVSAVFKLSTKENFAELEDFFFASLVRFLISLPELTLSGNSRVLLGTLTLHFIVDSS